MNAAQMSAVAVVAAAVVTLGRAWISESRVSRHSGSMLAAALALAGLGVYFPAITEAWLGTPFVGAALLFGLLLVWGLASEGVLEQIMRVPTDELTALIQAAARLDLRKSRQPASPEARAAAESLSNLVGALRDAVAKVRRAAETATDEVKSIRESVGTITAEGARRGERLSVAVGGAAGLREAVDGATRDLGALSALGSRLSSAVLEVESAVKEADSVAEKLSSLLHPMTTWIGDLNSSLLAVATSVETLAGSAEENASAMSAMDASIRAVERNADETARLSQQVERDAESGAESVERTIQGIGRIQEYALEVATVVGALGRRAEAIGDVVTVITEVAEQTNLLALNASIIAAQSGEHGRSFAVVADEIKDLAERTAASTKEIQDLVRAVQEETARAVGTIDRGKVSVAEGVELSGKAGAALGKILESARRSTRMATEIARATSEQGKGAQLVSASMTRVARMVEGIREETTNLAKNGDRIGRSAEELHSLSSELTGKVRAGGRGGAEALRLAGEVSSEAKRIDASLRARVVDAESIRQLLGELGNGEGADSKARSLEGATRDLESQLSLMKGELERFAV